MKKTAIIFTTKHGCAKQCASSLAEQLRQPVDLIQLKQSPIDLTGYDQIILGGSIYMGQIQKEMKAYCEEHKNQLLQKRIALFTCGLREKEEGIQQLNMNFPPELVEHAVAAETFGGKLVMRDMNWWEKLIIRMVAKTTTDQDTINQKNISEFANKWKQLSK